MALSPGPGKNSPWSMRELRLSQNFPHQLSCDIRESEVSSAVAKSKPFVIESQQVQESRMKVVDMNWIGTHVDSVVIGFTMNNARFDTSSCQPGRKDPMMMFPTFGILCCIKGGSTELSGPNHKGILKHPARL